MSNLDNKISLIRAFTRAFLVVALLVTLSYATLFVGSDFITPEVRGTILGGIVGGFGAAMTFYFKKNEEHKEVTNETTPD